MPAELNYGANSRIELEFAPDAFIARAAPPADGLLADPAEAVAAALAAPLEYPALAAAVVPGDRVAVVLADDLPQTPALAAGAVRALLQAGVEPASMTLLQTRAAREAGMPDPRGALETSLADEVELVVHDPADRPSLALLGASSRDEGVYLNRAICEADLVLLLSVVRLQQADEYRGGYADLFPAFSDHRIIERFRDLKIHESKGKRKKLRKETDEVGWLLGNRLVVQVVPGPGESVQHIVAGDVDAVAARGQQLAEASWHSRFPRRASLVIASIEGGDPHQNWTNLARVVEAARGAQAVEGAVALCTELATAPGPALMELADADDLDAALERIRDAHSPDAEAAWQLAHALKQGPVYLLSRLDDEVVESLGLAPVEQAAQIGRLARRFDSCIVLAGAQHAAVTIENEWEEDEWENDE
jgi:nickel-dependent lactate racemase